MNTDHRAEPRPMHGRGAARASLTVIAMMGIAGSAHAQTQTTPDSEADVTSVTDVVVTARRQAERLQDVPVSVQVVQGEDLDKLAITSLVSAAKLAPGLNFSLPAGAADASQAQISLRGVRFTLASGASAVPIYLNEAAMNPGDLLPSLYDVSQIEVLRGPQGTERGAPSITGAITITTKRPDLDEVGGYVRAQGGEGHHYNVQGGISVPIVPGKLAIRLAGYYDRSRANRVYSLNDDTNPLARIKSGRASVLFEPTDSLSLAVTYQRLEILSRTFTQVAGTGSPGFVVAGTPSRTLAPGFNGPPLATSDYRAVQNQANRLNKTNDMVTVNASWDVLGQNLSYVYGYNKAKLDSVVDDNTSNVLLGTPNLTLGTSGPRTQTHELRLASVPGDHLFDYAVGAYYSKQGPKDREVYVQDSIASYLAGSFGRPGTAPNPQLNAAALARYQLPLRLNIFGRQDNYSFFGNVTLHLPGDIEASGGLRWIHDRRRYNTFGNLLGGRIALAFPFPCSFIPGGAAVTSPIYGAGVCDIPIPPSPAFAPALFDQKNTPLLYSASLSKKFSEDLLVYFTTGSSYRTGIGNVGVSVSDPALLNTQPEKAKSYELGFKASLLERTVRFNADIFQIDYNGQLTAFPNIPYFNVSTGIIGTTPFAFYQNADARVRGIEGELGARIGRDLSLTANASYSKIESEGGNIPCADASRPLSATNIFNFCPARKGSTLNSAPPFQATLTGDYTIPINDLNGYFRFVANYQGKNPNFGYDNRVGAFATIDLFAGINGGRKPWELGVYANNVFNVNKTLQSLRDVPGSGLAVFGPSGYSRVIATAPREIGVTLRYAFGSD